MEDEDLMKGEEEWVECPSFEECTCDHDPEDHNWGSCTHDTCPCEGHWEE